MPPAISLIHQHLKNGQCVRFYLLTHNTTFQPAITPSQELTPAVLKRQI